MPFCVSVVGSSNSGKTTLLEKVVGELKRRGYRLATIKHSGHDFELDHPGKDSWRHARAGSDTVVISSPRKIALIKPVARDTGLTDLLRLIGTDFDFVLAEGFKNSSLPKIQVRRKEKGDPPCSEEGLLALVTDEPLNVSVPQFTPEEVSPLVDLLEQRLLAWRQADDVMRGQH